MAWKLFGGLSAVFAGIAARKALMTLFTKTTGRTPPANPQSPTTSWQEATAWAVLSGAVMGVARMLATRKAASYYQRSTGHLPKGMEKVT
jgi:uncharacterized protein DUF4235